MNTKTKQMNKVGQGWALASLEISSWSSGDCHIDIHIRLSDSDILNVQSSCALHFGVKFRFFGKLSATKAVN